LPRSGVQFVGVLLLAELLVASASSQNVGPQSANSAKPVAVVSSVRVVQDRGVPALEIVSDHPVFPAIQTLDSPPRLVIDLPNTHMGITRKRIPVQRENILTIRAEQYQIEPPLMRIVLDLLVPYGYSWDIPASNHLMVRLKPPGDPTEAANAVPKKKPPQAMSLTPTATPVAVPVTSGVGDVVLAGKQFAVGSSLTAGAEAAVLQLSRGGEVRVCAGTTVSVTPAKNAKDLMLGMSTGALETHYALAASSDIVLTPDFRILFAGPGIFHYAISADSHGTTCVRSLKGNTAAAVVSELIGNRVYQVKATEQAVFHSGQIDKVDTDVPLECGCLAPSPVIRTNATPTVLPDAQTSPHAVLADGSSPGSVVRPDGGAPRTLSNGPETQPLPPSKPNEVHIQVDAPLVYEAKQHPKITSAPMDEAEALPVIDSSRQPISLDTQILPPPAASPNAKAKHRSVLRHIGRIFVEVFR
jgi:hypothetical protein